MAAPYRKSKAPEFGGIPEGNILVVLHPAGRITPRPAGFFPYSDSQSEPARPKAEECRQEAHKATDHHTKAGWLKITDKWQRMPQQADPPAQ
jgi:hypothetical protein